MAAVTTCSDFRDQKCKVFLFYMFPLFPHLFAMKRWDHAGLEEAQARIKIAGKNINNLRYADDTTLMAESEEELKSS